MGSFFPNYVKTMLSKAIRLFDFSDFCWPVKVNLSKLQVEGKEETIFVLKYEKKITGVKWTYQRGCKLFQYYIL